jgi:hypothetical protein
VEHDEGSKGKEPVMEDKEKMVSYWRKFEIKTRITKRIYFEGEKPNMNVWKKI